MERNIYIRDTKITVVEVLERLACGFCFDQVLKQIPILNLSDILGAIQFAAELIDQHVTSEERIEIHSEILLKVQGEKIVNLTKI